MKTPFYCMFKRFYIAALAVLISFISVPLSLSWAQSAAESPVPLPSQQFNLSSPFVPAHLQGLTVHPDNALQFDFLVNKGDSTLSESEKKQEYNKLIKYFLASLTIPDQDQWVNLSPYEKDRIIEHNFGTTEMGRELLEEDYLLKQITSSLMYPESKLGKKFWDKVYAKAWAQYHTTNIRVNTFNKVWIVPDQAIVYDHGNTAYILKSHLKVMLEEDYLAAQKNSQVVRNNNAEIIRKIILPSIEKEVNEGKNFAQLRQIYSAMILATWYKRTLKNSLLGKVYADRGKVKGVDQPCTTDGCAGNEAVYEQYLAAFKKGLYNYIRMDMDQYTHKPIERKYFAGGFINELSDGAMIIIRNSMAVDIRDVTVAKKAAANGAMDHILVDLAPSSADSAMRSKVPGGYQMVDDRFFFSADRQGQERFTAQLLSRDEEYFFTLSYTKIFPHAPPQQKIVVELEPLGESSALARLFLAEMDGEKARTMMQDGPEVARAIVVRLLSSLWDQLDIIHTGPFQQFRQILQRIGIDPHSYDSDLNELLNVIRTAVREGRDGDARVKIEVAAAGLIEKVVGQHSNIGKEFLRIRLMDDIRRVRRSIVDTAMLSEAEFEASLNKFFEQGFELPPAELEALIRFFYRQHPAETRNFYQYRQQKELGVDAGETLRAIEGAFPNIDFSEDKVRLVSQLLYSQDTHVGRMDIFVLYSGSYKGFVLFLRQGGEDKEIELGTDADRARQYYRFAVNAAGAKPMQANDPKAEEILKVVEALKLVEIGVEKDPVLEEIRAFFVRGFDLPSQQLRDIGQYCYKEPLFDALTDFDQSPTPETLMQVERLIPVFRGVPFEEKRRHIQKLADLIYMDANKSAGIYTTISFDHKVRQYVLILQHPKDQVTTHYILAGGNRLYAQRLYKIALQLDENPDAHIPTEEIPEGMGGKVEEIRTQVERWKDRAMAAPPGGIDFNSQHMQLLIKGGGIKAPTLSPQDLAMFSRITGFIPVIRQIKPATGLPFLSDL